MGLKWGAIFCPQAKYVMKTDDDIFVNIPLLHKALTEENFDRITGECKNKKVSFLPPSRFTQKPFSIRI